MPNYLNMKKDGWKLFIDESLAVDDFVDLCCRDGKDNHPVFTAVRSSKLAAVFRFERGGKAYYYKEYLYSSLWKHRNVLRRGAHLMRIADQMNEAGFSTPPIVCHARRGNQVFTVSEEAESDLKHKQILFCAETRETIPDMMRFRRLFGREIGRFHAAGFSHGDLRWGNVLIKSPESEQPVFIYLDNDRTKKYRKLPDRLRLKNLVQLRFDVRMVPDPEAEWAAFWRAYLAENPELEASAERWKNKVNRKTAQRIEALRRKPKNRRMHQNAE